jgi:hypothetical protein
MSLRYYGMRSKRLGPGGCSNAAKHVVFRFPVYFASRLRTVFKKIFTQISLAEMDQVYGPVFLAGIYALCVSYSADI